MSVQGSIVNDYTRQEFSHIPSEYHIKDITALKNEPPIKVHDSLISLKTRAIVDLTTSDLIRKLSNGQLTSVEVVKAYIESASYAHQLTNCLTEILFYQALERAKELDVLFQRTGAPIGPLHGLPISVKDEFDIEGVRTTLGLISRANSDPIGQTSPNLQILLSQGAIILAKTAVPIGAFNRQTFNNLFGVTLHPQSTQLNPSGSTGGEASLVALKGSALGVGSDLGGSIRQPCSLTGLFGLRPSSLRVPHSNPHCVVPGLESLRGVNGPIGRDVDTLKVYLKSVLDGEPWKRNINVVPLPWNSDVNVELNKTVTVAVLRSDGVVDPTPPIQRAIEIVLAKLRNQGVKIIEVDEDIASTLSEVASLAGEFMISGGNKLLLEELKSSGESVPYLSFLESTIDLQVSELWKKHIHRDQLVSKVIHWWGNNNITALLSPVSAQSYLYNDADFIDHTYGAFVNVLDFPSVTFPVTKLAIEDYRYNEISRLTQDSKTVLNEYLSTKDEDKQKFIGNIPIGLQLVGWRYKEEALLALVEKVTEGLETDDLVV